MKRKIGLALAVILVGVLVVVYTQTKGEKVEPTSTPISSSISASSAPVATEEPAASTEPTPSSQPVNQEVEEGYSNEGAEPVEETDESLQQLMSEHDEQFIQECIDQFGVTREEAEEMLQKSNEMAAESQAQMEQNRQEASEEFWKNHDAAVESEIAEQEAQLQERYGLSIEEWGALSAKEQLDYAMTHPANS